ncbi:MAG: UDP-N-acetylglucosamine 2-epimerase (non-hydrolyzing), partial [Thermoleophilia bacterium]|nr:UDP-N-acetylglucosamine 2-epimerase (non-hydrolyzing) [Thermoleophilia bacterium]
MRILTIIGNRPQFVKLAAVSPLLRERHSETLVHTGQHHDHELSQIFFDEFGLPAPDVQLGIAGGGNSSQTSRMLAALEPLVHQHDPDLILVYGDTNSTLAGALVAAQCGVPLAHVEAGLRSFDRSMPEEVNRVVCDALASLLLAPGEAAAANLAREGVIGEIVIAGDVMGDVVLGLRDRVDTAAVCAEYGVQPDGFILLTAHRVATVDTPQRLASLVELIESLDLPVLFPVHPRTRARMVEQDLLARLSDAAGVRLLPPLGYGDTVALAGAARAVLTDSGGLQKEAVWLGTQCLTLRPSTEWTETVDSGWNVLVDLDRERVAAALADG